ncbi:MAG: hypothetical protein ACO1TE_11225 [Prosthecobacter sp.]
MKTILCCLILLTGAVCVLRTAAAANDQPRPQVRAEVKQPRKVSVAVADFNRRMALDDIGKTQRPITEKEVLDSLAVAARFFHMQPEGSALDQYIVGVITTQTLPAYADLKIFKGATALGEGPDIPCWTVFVEFELDRFHEPGKAPAPRALVRHVMLP